MFCGGFWFRGFESCVLVGYRESACKKEIEDCGMEENKKAKIWSSPEKDKEFKIGKMIFCNRSLNMKNIVAVGFDMDYTLAQYKPETFEVLAYEGTVRKLVTNLQYPIEVCALLFVFVFFVWVVLGFGAGVSWLFW